MDAATSASVGIAVISVARRVATATRRRCAHQAVERVAHGSFGDLERSEHGAGADPCDVVGVRELVSPSRQAQHWQAMGQ